MYWLEASAAFSHLYAVSLLVIIGQVEQLQGKTCPKASDHLLVQLSQPNLALSQAQVACPELLIKIWANQPTCKQSNLPRL